MSYGRQQERKYQPPPPPTLKKGFKPKGDFEKDLITRETEKALRERKEPE